MWFRSIFDSANSAARRPSRRSKKRGPRRRRLAQRLRLEALESRSMLTFLAPVEYYEGAYGAATVAAGDFANNGIQDLAVAGDGTVGVLMGNGDGTFQPVHSYTTPGASITASIAVGDVTGDGNLDIVVGDDDNSYQTNATAGSVSVLVGNGDGTFQAAVTFDLPNVAPPGSTTPLPQYPMSLALGDMNHDGKLDAVVGAYTDSGYNACNHYIDVLVGHGDGSFSLGSATPLAGQFAGYERASSLVLGDFNGGHYSNGDDILDVATTTGSSVAVLPGNGDGTLGAESDIAAGPAPNSLAAGDINGDGNLDLVATGGSDISVLLSNGDGSFTERNTSQPAGGVVVGDLDGDGKLDLAGLFTGPPNGNYGGSSYLNILLGDGEGDFTHAQSVPLLGAASNMSVADLNGDGFADLTVADFAQPSVFYDPFAEVLLNGADWPTGPHPGSFSVSGFPSTTPAGTPGSFTVTAFNADGTIDTGYTGTVHFDSSDGQASLPGDFTFTAADKGVHAFSATLKTAGTQTIGAVDTTFGYVLGYQTGITVTPLAAVSLTVSGFPSTIAAGDTHVFTVAATDEYGNVATDYAGTVSFSSNDPQASLPASFTFTAGSPDTAWVFATLKTAGTQSITATSGSFTGTEGGIAVHAAVASQFILSAPASVTAGAPFSLTVTVEDAYGNIVTDYTGTIHFSSSDVRAVLPADYTFTAGDGGVHTFTGLVLNKTGNQTITLTDMQKSNLASTADIYVYAAVKKHGH